MPDSTLSLSVIIPTYNAASWLPKTIPRVVTAIENAGIKSAEIIVVDDGSSDDSASVAKSIKSTVPIKVVSQKNSGRFVARKTGTKHAQYEFILFIDTRIYITPNGLKFIAKQLKKNPERRVWTSHVYLDKQSNMYARFWDGLTSLAWRRYFANPRDYSYGIAEFDYFPKGTTCFFVPKKVIEEANAWFEQNTKDLKTSNDDTLLIRRIAEQQNININPQFSCTYHARSNLKQFTKHVFHRGKVFVDGFLRKDGNRFFWPLVAFLALSLIVPLWLIFNLHYVVPFVVAGLVLWLLELAVVMLSGIPKPDAWSLWILTPIFSVAYGLGIWTAFYRLHLKPLVVRPQTKVK